jgi:hypothetical protein
MHKTLALVLLCGSVALSQYKTEPAGAPPSELSPGIAGTLQQPGIKVLSPSGSPYAELWFRKDLPAASKSAEEAVTFPTIAHGTLIGTIRFTDKGADRRGNTIKPGVYTLRYSLYPVNGDHQGVAPQRDFLVLVNAADDKDPASTPGFDDLMALARKASGLPHPLVLSISPSSGDSFPSVAKEGEKDWVLNVKVGNTPMAVILVGKAEG